VVHILGYFFVMVHISSMIFCVNALIVSLAVLFLLFHEQYVVKCGNCLSSCTGLCSLSLNELDFLSSFI
jgi:hypothetical protein